MLMSRPHAPKGPRGERSFTGHVVDPCRSVNNKRGRQKRVTWATEDRIRQVILFVSDDELPISQSLLSGRLDMPTSLEAQQVLPPGFEASSAKRLRFQCGQEQLCVERLWETPQKFVPHPAWWVGNGNESLEVAVQKQREPRELEAVYPRPTSIPNSPAEPFENPQICDEASVPQISLIPIEDENDCDEEDENDCDEEDESSNEILNNPDDISGVVDPPCVRHGMKHLQGVADPDIAAAVAAALMVVKDPGLSSRVDEDLLIKILKNPILLQTLSSTNKFLQGSVGVVSPRKVLDESTTTIVTVPSSMPPICEGKGDEHQTEKIHHTVKILLPDSLGVSETSSDVPLNIKVQPGTALKHWVPNKETSPLAEKMSVEWIAEQQSKVTCNQSSPTSPIEWSSNASPSVRESDLPSGHETAAGTGTKDSYCAQNKVASPPIEWSPNVSPSIRGSDLSNCHERAGTGTKVLYGPQTKVASLPSGPSNHQSTSRSTSKDPIWVSGIPDHVPSSRTESLARACINHTASMSRLSSHPRNPRHGEKQRGIAFTQARCNLDARNHSVSDSSVLRVSNGKSRKQCVFFNTPRGCRKGASCEFLHQTDNSANPCYHSSSLVQ